jgi:flagellar basal body-associated protein FliL
MTKALACLSFFKQNKIHYYYEEAKNVIAFPCFTCQNQIELDTLTTKWNCNTCGLKGNLVTLITFQKENNVNQIKEVKVYNPTIENREVRYLVRKIDEKYHTKDTEKLVGKIEELLNYYNKKLS